MSSFSQSISRRMQNNFFFFFAIIGSFGLWNGIPVTGSLKKNSKGSTHMEPLWWLNVKNLPAVQETQVRFLGGEDSLEDEIATHSSVLTWEILWTEEPGGLQYGVYSSWGCKRVGCDLVTQQQQKQKALTYHTQIRVLLYGKSSSNPGAKKKKY